MEQLLEKYFVRRRVFGEPLTAGFVLQGVDGVDKNGFLELVREMRRSFGWGRVFFCVQDFIGFYVSELDGFSYGEVSKVFGVSEKVLYGAGRDLCGLNGVGQVERLDDPALRCESFGFSGGGGVEGFALFLVDGVDLSGRRNDVWAAAALLVAGKVI